MVLTKIYNLSFDFKFSFKMGFLILNWFEVFKWHLQIIFFHFWLNKYLQNKLQNHILKTPIHYFSPWTLKLKTIEPLFIQH